MRAYTQLVEEEGTLTGLEAYSAVAAAALRGARDHHRVVPRPRDRAAQHQPAAPHLAQGDRGRDDDAVDRSRTSTSAARSPSATCSPTSTPRPTSAARSTRRCARARTSRRSGSTCSPATSTGSSPTTPAAATRPSSATRATTSSSPSPASAAPSTSCAGMVSEGRKRGLLLRPDRRARQRQPGPPLRPGAPRARSTSGYDADFALRRRRRRLGRAGRGVAVDAGVHAVRGLRDDRRGSPTRSCAASRSLADGAIVGEPVGRFVRRSGRRAPQRR